MSVLLSRISSKLGHIGIYEHIALPLPGHKGGPIMGRFKDGIGHFVQAMREQTSAQESKSKGQVLIGHSLGGMLACHYAQKYPDDIKGLVLLDIMPPLQSKSDPVTHFQQSSRGMTLKHLLNFLCLLRVVGGVISAAGLTGLLMPKKKDLDPLLLRWPAWSRLSAMERRYILRGYDGNKLRGVFDYQPQVLKRLMFLHRPETGLFDVDIPTLIIRCERSDFIKAEPLRQLKDKNANISSVEIPGNHWILADREVTEIVAEIASNWILQL